MRNEIMKTLLTVFKTNDSFMSMMTRLTLGLVMFPHGAQKALTFATPRTAEILSRAA
jgi:hypothetical protein